MGMDIGDIVGEHHLKYDQRGLTFFRDDGPYRRLRFMTVPKCASTSIRLGLGLCSSGERGRSVVNGVGPSRPGPSRPGPSRPGPSRPRVVCPVRVVRFCVLRDPLDRFVSGYCELLRRGPGDVLGRFAVEGFWRELDPVRQFDLFVRCWSYYGPFEGHVALQSYFVGGFKMSYYLRFERVGDDLNRMLRLSRLPGVNLPVENQWVSPVRGLVVELVSRPVYRDLIMRWLRFDYELLSGVRFI